ncbi:hypothetical protein N7532_008127 [Penicillium argentinense]|uniref:Uncharacterized protein n=1 Tax=Penicillium argentinense TaxID=1131581 RepID=A0A9W9K1B4_9EURO|nr:uncharacterized protein N7532_008127 [Penicillium argentinense]KAJ5089443.1 hypothetical protein N7532_008127 [Penicillium argentinense]
MQPESNFMKASPQNIKENPKANFWLAVGGILLLWTFYKVEIYPSFISPLRHLPGPKAIHLLDMGSSRFKTPMGPDFLEFMDKVPNDGLIHTGNSPTGVTYS